MNGASGVIEIQTTLRRSKWSASRPPISVAIAPEMSITLSAVLPSAVEVSSSMTK